MEGRGDGDCVAAGSAGAGERLPSRSHRAVLPEGLLRGAEVKGVTKVRRGLKHQAAYSPGTAGLLRGAEVKGVTNVQRGLIQAGAPGCLQPRDCADSKQEPRRSQLQRKRRPSWEQGKGLG
ncbi:hypothetical protein D623_10005988 [Myotis brandtii]|uniref:Uncharacterized protein n=1 Tax=Myotis brandtii TaxID=109478 RepID=S7PWR6_MYOBR|nr:hypothetical protein D623_10005988 [Myotis brandtii]